VAAKRVDASAGAAHIAQQQLQHGGGADDLRAEAVLGPADRVNDGRGLFHVAVFADGREEVGSLQELIFGDAGDAFHHLRRVAGILLLEELIDAARMFERHVEGDVAGKRGAWTSRGLRSSSSTGRTSATPIEAGIKAVFGQFESFLDEKRRVGEIDQVLFGDALILDGVVNHAAQERNVGPARICRNISEVAAVACSADRRRSSWRCARAWLQSPT
jgi:hypothetical protein